MFFDEVDFLCDIVILIQWLITMAICICKFPIQHLVFMWN